MTAFFCGSSIGTVRTATKTTRWSISTTTRRGCSTWRSVCGSAWRHLHHKFVSTGVLICSTWFCPLSCSDYSSFQKYIHKSNSFWTHACWSRCRCLSVKKARLFLQGARFLLFLFLCEYYFYYPRALTAKNSTTIRLYALQKDSTSVNFVWIFEKSVEQ